MQKNWKEEVTAYIAGYGRFTLEQWAARQLAMQSKRLQGCQLSYQRFYLFVSVVVTCRLLNDFSTCNVNGRENAAAIHKFFRTIGVVMKEKRHCLENKSATSN